MITMRKPYLQRLNDGVLLFDGAMATYLFTKGVYLKKCFEEVCMTNPQMVLDVHREYVARGAQALETNSYGANPLKLQMMDLPDMHASTVCRDCRQFDAGKINLTAQGSAWNVTFQLRKMPAEQKAAQLHVASPG